jgi:DNA-binding HxlR family transcriptional regulator
LWKQIELGGFLEDLIEYVLRSSYRMRVITAIGDGVVMPHQIAQKSSVLNNHISTTLRQLREHGIVELINPEMPRGRLYRLSNKGKEVLNEIKGENYEKNI